MTTNTTLPPPTPLAAPGQPVDWWFAFKFNATEFPGCTDDGKAPVPGTVGIFGGTVEEYTLGQSQQYVYATSAASTLVKGEGCLGATPTDPLGATFGAIFDTPGYNYVVWNDQLKGDPVTDQDGPWGHSKGMLAWNDDGDGLLLQVSTPSWPGSGSRAYPRAAGNTLGAIGDDDDIEVSQHFFAVKLRGDDVATVARALANASVVTDTLDAQIVLSDGLPAAVDAIVRTLGVPAAEHGRKTPTPPPVPGPPTCTIDTLSTGVRLISKPSALHLPPWHVASGMLGGLPLRVASWWDAPKIYSTSGHESIDGWPSTIALPGAVETATSGIWGTQPLGLLGESKPPGNHAKVAVSTDPSKTWCVFGDMNQQGALWVGYAHAGQQMSSSQNGRGGLFLVVDDAGLHASVSAMLAGDSAPVGPAGPSIVAAAAPSGATIAATPPEA